MLIFNGIKNINIMKIQSYISLGLLLVLISSCNNFLDLQPQSEITDVVFWKNPADFKLAANWFYQNTLDDPRSGGINNSDNMSDIAEDTQPDPVSSGTYVPPSDDGVWNGAYAGIRNANKLITEGENSSIKDQISAYIGEGYFFRAYNYYTLFKLYGGVPLIDKVLDTTDPEIYNARATRDAILNFILSDLDMAISDLSDKSTTDAGRICKEAAEAFKARVCLFEGTWRKFRGTADANTLLDLAILESKNVIDSKSYHLYSGKGIESYRYMFIDNTSENNPESIISKHYRMFIDPIYWVEKITWGYMSPTKKIADLYLCSDGLPINKSPLFEGYDSCRTEFYNRDPRMSESIIIPADSIFRPQFTEAEPQWPGVGNNRNVNSGYMLYKFISEVASPSSSSAGNFDWNDMRYAEVLLIYAESTFERNGSISDADLDLSINLLRDRVHMPHLTNGIVAANGLDMRTEIRRERTVELAFEGYRWDDLRRWKTAETELPNSLLSIKVTGTQWDSPQVTIGDASTSGIFYNLPDSKLENGFLVLQPGSQRSFDPAKNYLLPLPTKQISLNPALVQNPNW
ncbi:MAG: RagB/SusD family nutrient uptake outer membrane protein [Peptostreptococcaceae bacterium]|nr:RagB/SusD family nutrient uptake outer membrane protein [Peptostreptococcaceae bacterium]